MVDHTSHDLLTLYRAGDCDAAAEIFDRYVRRLVELARQRISTRLARRIDPEDVVQSAYRSFFIHARDGEFALQRAGDLWRLLAAITLNKLHGQVERHTAARRAINKEELTGIDPETQTREPTPDEVAGINEQLQLMMSGLNQPARQSLEMRLQGKTIEEIAVAINRSQRTVRRLLQSIQSCCEAQLES